MAGSIFPSAVTFHVGHNTACVQFILLFAAIKQVSFNLALSDGDRRPGRETCTINDQMIHAAGLRVAHDVSGPWTEPSSAAHALPISRPDI